MELTMIRYGLLLGLSYLVTMHFLQWLTAPAAWPDAPAHLPVRTECDITDQVFDLLAEARRITEEG